MIEDNMDFKDNEPIETFIPIKRDQVTCPICNGDLRVNMFKLIVYGNRKKTIISGSIDTKAIYCNQCKSYFFDEDIRLDLKTRGYETKYKVKQLERKSKENQGGIGESDKSKYNAPKTPKENEYIPRCSNCMEERSGKCLGLKGLCESHKPCPERDVLKYDYLIHG